MVGTLRSYLTALRVSGRFGRATKLEREGRVAEALVVGREALALLRAPHIVRSNPPEASVLVSLTMLIERLSFELRQPGAELVDLRDSVRALENLGDHGTATVRQMRDDWLPFLRSRLENAGG
jgi:hypothetical protein